MSVVASSHQHFLCSLAVHPTSGELYAMCAASGDLLRCDVERGVFAEVLKFVPAPAAIAFAANPRTSAAGDADTWVATCSPLQGLVRCPGPLPCARQEEADATGGRGEGAAVPEVKLQPLALGHRRCDDIDATADVQGAVRTSAFAPTALAVSPLDGEIFFTEAGFEAESSLAERHGGVYRTVHGRTSVVALQSSGLAQPTGIAAGSDGCVYMTEMCENRLLRYVPRDGGARYAGAVFARFQGTMGPSAVAVHPTTGRVYVTLYETPEVASAYAAARAPLEGIVVELDRDGRELCTYTLPDTQLRAVAVGGRGAECLYVVSSDSATCWSTLYRLPLVPPPSEV